MRRDVGAILRCTLASIVTALVCGAPMASAQPDLGPSRDAGALQLVDVAGRPLRSGNSETPVARALPDGVTCPGDSANDGWRWQTFIVPEGVDIGTLEYGGIGPVGDGQKALYDTTARYLSHQNLLPNTAAGQPAKLPTIPFINFSAFPEGYFPTGKYSVGVACTLDRRTATYWHTGFEIEETSVDGGVAGFRWTAPAAPAGAVDAPLGDPFNWRPLAGGVIATVALGAALVLWRSARARPAPHSKEPA